MSSLNGGYEFQVRAISGGCAAYVAAQFIQEQKNPIMTVPITALAGVSIQLSNGQTKPYLVAMFNRRVTRL